MLATWVFIMLVEGKEPQAFQSDSEARCKVVMARMLYVQRAQRQKATGACYVRASAIDDTERQLIGTPISR